MSEPAMPLEKAWEILGRDPRALIAAVKSLPDLASRLTAVEEALLDARRRAKASMARNHPDRNPGDGASLARFHGAQEALESIAWHTDKLRDAVRRAAEEPERPRGKGLIVIQG